MADHLNFENVVIEAIGGALPTDIWSSDRIEAELSDVYQRLSLPAGRLELMTGIRERRFWPADHRPSSAATEAAEGVLQRGDIDPQSIDLLVHCGVCRDRLEPATAAYVHGNLGLAARAQIFDLSNACLGFLNAMVVVAGLIESGQVDRALIVSGENGRPLLDWTLGELRRPDLTRRTIKPYFANLTIGAGAVAAVIGRRRSSGQSYVSGIRTAVVETDSSANSLCEGGDSGANSLAMVTDSEELLRAGVAVAERAWQRFCRATGWTAADPQRVICHQVGKQHQRAVFAALGIPLDKDYPTFPWLGNVGSVSCPLTYSIALDNSAVQPRQPVVLMGIGSGLSSLMVALDD